MTLDESSNGSGAPDSYDEASSRTSLNIARDAENGMLPKQTLHHGVIEPTEEIVPVQDIPPRDMRTWQWILLSGGVLFATILLALDNTIVANLQPQIVEAFGEISKFPWINLNYSLGAVASGLLWGKLYGIFETKKLFLSAVLLFEVGSAVCGAARNMDMLIVGRVICGIGGNGLYIGAMNIISAFTSAKERPLYFSFFGITWGGGTVLGPIIGALFSQSTVGWRWSFYLNLVAGAVLIPIYVFLLPLRWPVPDCTLSTWTLIKRMDCVGWTLFAGSLVSLIMAISFGGAKYSWASGPIIGLFGCFAALVTLLGVQQGKTVLTTKHDRILPVQSFRDGEEMFILVIQTACPIAILFIGLNYIPIYLQFVRSESALSAAIQLLPMIFTAVIFMLLTGFLVERIGYYAYWYLTGSLLAVAGTALMYTINNTSSHARIYGYSVLFSAGLSLYIQASYPLAQAKVRPTQSSDAVTIIGCTQLGSIAIFLAVANSIFLNRATDGIQRVLPDVPRSMVQAAISGTDAQIFRDLDEERKARILSMIMSAVQDVWILAIAAAVLSFLVAVFMRKEKRPGLRVVT